MVEVMPGVSTRVVTRLRTISSRSGIGRRVACWRVTPVGGETDVHTFFDFDPYEYANMCLLLACE